jgi:pyridoxamine 5'-phosphate oxidase
MDLAAEPMEQFARWFAEAVSAGQPEPEAMCLSTATTAGAPSSRMVLLKRFDVRGFVFYTNERSEKGRQLGANPLAALTWRWAMLDRQVRVTGAVTAVDGAEADEYFATRARGSQIGAWASAQSSVVWSGSLPVPAGATPRAPLDAAVRAAEDRFAGSAVPRPPHWGGFLVVPSQVEFWQGQPDRLHDRLRYRRDSDGWVVERLSP